MQVLTTTSPNLSRSASFWLVSESLAGTRRIATTTPANSVFTVGALRLDLDKRQVLVNEKEVHLTPIEYKLLSTLARNAGRVVTHQQLLKEVWGTRFGTQTQYLHVYMGQLRSKLEAEPTRPRLLLTEPGVGYRLKGE
jgi:two-component system KDP operon response regulator KdpE